jgi:hypothetical protein
METKSIIEVEESIQSALEVLPSILRATPSTPLTRQLTEALQVLMPVGYHPVVELQENGRRKRRTASAENWTPETGEILISFSKDFSSEQLQKPSPEPPRAPFVGPLTRQLLDIRDKHAILAEQQAPTIKSQRSYGAIPPDPRAIKAGLPQVSSSSSSQSPASPEVQELCHALEEVERQGRSFVALKWFRDDVLASKGFSWTADPEQRQAVLAAAIDNKLVVTSRVPNPRSPFPTTAIRLNRTPTSPQSEGRRYSPVRVQGEPLSSTIMRDRGTY